ncbi:MAG: hypothetical protein U1E73_03670 [Planctomycetota bacterium]
MSETAEPVGLHPCARCAAVQKTCCQRAEIFVTTGDVARIRKHSGSDGFYGHRAPVDPAYAEPDPDDPEWPQRTVRADGMRRVLNRRPGGDCAFLGAFGCVLPLDVRPLVCRLYPFEYTAGGIVGVASDYCPTRLLAPAGQPMTAVLGMSAVEAEGWRRQLYQEIRDGAP